MAARRKSPEPDVKAPESPDTQESAASGPEPKAAPEPEPRPKTKAYVARTPVLVVDGSGRRRFEIGEPVVGVKAEIIESLLERDLIKLE